MEEKNRKKERRRDFLAGVGLMSLIVLGIAGVFLVASEPSSAAEIEVHKKEGGFELVFFEMRTPQPVIDWMNSIEGVTHEGQDNNGWHHFSIDNTQLQVTPSQLRQWTDYLEHRLVALQAQADPILENSLDIPERCLRQGENTAELNFNTETLAWEIGQINGEWC